MTRSRTGLRSALLALLIGTGLSSAAAPGFRAVDITVQHDMSHGRVSVSPTASPTLGVTKPTVRNGVAYVGMSREMGKYGVTLSSKFPLSLHFDTVMGTVTADLRGAALDRLDINLKQTHYDLTLPARTFSGSLKTSQGTVTLKVPANTGVRLKLDRVERGTVTLGSEVVSSGRTLSTSAASSNYETARYRIDLTVVSDQTKIEVQMP